MDVFPTKLATKVTALFVPATKVATNPQKKLKSMNSAGSDKNQGATGQLGRSHHSFKGTNWAANPQT